MSRTSSTSSGPVATTQLLKHGVLFPPNSHNLVSLLPSAAGGTLLLGIGGDELLGSRSLEGVPRPAGGTATTSVARRERDLPSPLRPRLATRGAGSRADGASIDPGCDRRPRGACARTSAARTTSHCAIDRSIERDARSRALAVGLASLRHLGKAHERADRGSASRSTVRRGSCPGGRSSGMGEPTRDDAGYRGRLPARRTARTSATRPCSPGRYVGDAHAALRRRVGVVAASIRVWSIQTPCGRCGSRLSPMCEALCFSSSLGYTTTAQERHPRRQLPPRNRPWRPGDFRLDLVRAPYARSHSCCAAADEPERDVTAAVSAGAHDRSLRSAQPLVELSDR